MCKILMEFRKKIRDQVKELGDINVFMKGFADYIEWSGWKNVWASHNFL